MEVLLFEFRRDRGVGLRSSFGGRRRGGVQVRQLVQEVGVVLCDVVPLGPLQQQPLDGFPRHLGVVVLRADALAGSLLDRGKERAVPVPFASDDFGDLPEPGSALLLHGHKAGKHIEELVVRIGSRQRPDDVGLRETSAAVGAFDRIPGAFIEGQDDRDPLLDRTPAQGVSEAGQDLLDHFGGHHVGGGFRVGVLGVPLSGGGIHPLEDGRDHLGRDPEIPRNSLVPSPFPRGAVGGRGRKRGVPAA